MISKQRKVSMRIILFLVMILMPSFCIFAEDFINKIDPIITTNQQQLDTEKKDGKNTQSICKALYNAIDDELKRSNYCVQDSDCKTMELGGPLVEFGCFHFINKDVDSGALYNKMLQYHNKCSGVVDDCSSAAKPVCVKNKCEMSPDKK